MKAWWAAETDDWGFYVHGETANQAKARAFRCEPSDFWEYLEIRVRRVPKMDGQPFTFERLGAAGFTVTEEDGEPASEDAYANFCDCELCAAAAQEPVAKVCQLYAAFFESSQCVPYDPDRNWRDYHAWIQAHMALSRSDQRKAEKLNLQLMGDIKIEWLIELIARVSNNSNAFVLNERPCGECAQFKPNQPEWMFGEAGLCRKKLMGVTRTMLASCPVGQSCFEPAVVDGIEDRADE